MTAVAHAAPGPADPDAVSRTPDDPDLQLARDPRAGAGRLMVLAGNRPDLRGVIADNPGCSPELRAWVSRMGGASAGSGRGGHGGHSGPEAAASRADGADDAVSLAPTGWEPSDIGLGDDPFGSVLGDPLMGSPLFDDGGALSQEPAAEPADAAGRNGRGGPRPSSSRRTAKSHTASARTASARTASRTAAARATQTPAPPPQRPAVTMPAPPAPMPPGRFAPAAPYPVPGIAGPVGIAGGAPGRMEADPWAVGGAPAGGRPPAPPLPSGAPGIPGASFGMGGYNAAPSSRSARRSAPSSSSTSPVKIIGWILFVLLFIVIRALNG
ncbi:hypothetical protein [Actinomyces oris]|uniref:Leucine rich repeat variant domain-containing protein n=1 Tax=Actinomyces oris TaxID=544580 RepID=A0A1Q8XDL8_9ACTO|nr:hypothetical protein [Actinomyces oris]OLO78431.1 hypothetical protein BKH15_04420 [Actinomyces oris]